MSSKKIIQNTDISELEEHVLHWEEYEWLHILTHKWTVNPYCVVWGWASVHTLGFDIAEGHNKAGILDHSDLQ